MINIVLKTIAQTEFAFGLNDGINICGFFIHEVSEHSVENWFVPRILYLLEKLNCKKLQICWGWHEMTIHKYNLVQIFRKAVYQYVSLTI